MDEAQRQFEEWAEHLRECGRQCAQERERALAAEARLADTKGALRGMLELDSYRPRDGLVNPEWEAAILADARAALAP